MRARLFPLWLLGFYGAWLALVARGDHWGTVVAHWPIAASMALGSYVAGATPMGGGSVGFPVLVLLFDLPATLGRDFSFAIQAVGMTSASLYIIASRRRVAWRLLAWALLGALLGTPLGLRWVAPHLPGGVAEIAFAVIWASFGLMALTRLSELSGASTPTPTTAGFDRAVGVAIGALGGALIAAVTGVGVDMLICVVLVLIVRADLKIAVPTSIVLMAGTSIIGAATQWLSGGFAPETFEHWVAAAPIVALGAPLGALVVNLVGARLTLALVSGLCLLQFAWVGLVQWQRMGWHSVLLGGGGLLAFHLVFRWMNELGKRMRQRAREPVPGPERSRRCGERAGPRLTSDDGHEPALSSISSAPMSGVAPPWGRSSPSRSTATPALGSARPVQVSSSAARW
ncbi:sulfite exporter TauE/SafE family protein [Haliangium sp.]|uniref:sulfite exporter TauE/SafE family protein n=1 Tax=Haliangium sp. TaxID=2663208 RepID=UPI003D0A9137